MLYYLVEWLGGKELGLKYSSKINKIRTFALSLVFVGFGIMYLGIFFKEIVWLMSIFMILGLLSVVLSTLIYFWIGMLSTKTIQVVCPNCNKPTKILGRVDACMHCNEPLTLDKDLEGKEFDENYNSKQYQKEQQEQQ
ncbi:YgzB family protein [Pontibacillus marinus]|uniref:YgzB family protein n=1 Tax=Pontibacillus marinus TaxID=273164 RepID=UPI00068696AB|nr:YgzB family protein [Pontibacillus marinus]